MASSNIINKGQINFLPEEWTVDNFFTLQISKKN